MIETALAGLFIMLAIIAVGFAIARDPDDNEPVSLESSRDSRAPSSIGDLEPRPDLQRRRR